MHRAVNQSPWGLIQICNSSEGQVKEGPPLELQPGFDSESGQTNDFNVGIYSFPAWRSAFKRHCGEQDGKFTCAVGKGT